MAKKAKKGPSNSYIPKLSWPYYLDSIKGRYPYVLPTVPACGPHPMVGGEVVPGGMPRSTKGSA